MTLARRIAFPGRNPVAESMRYDSTYRCGGSTGLAATVVARAPVSRLPLGREPPSGTSNTSVPYGTGTHFTLNQAAALSPERSGLGYGNEGRGRRGGNGIDATHKPDMGVTQH